MGFVVNSTYAVQHFPSAEAYFDAILTEKDVMDISAISKRYTGIVAYSGCLARLRHRQEIIEFEPYQYIHIRRLEKMGIGQEQLKAYCNQVRSFANDDEYFSIRSIRERGFESELDDLGFGDLFYGSLLREDDRFSWQKIGKALVFRSGRNSFQARDFLVHLVEKAEAMDIDEFVQTLRERFGVDIDKHKVLEKLKDSDVYYDQIMEKVYADYELYFEEI